jgi:hypothetical protein
VQEKFSLVRLSSLEVSQSSQCIMRITVLPDTSSGKHKAKVVGGCLYVFIPFHHPPRHNLL